MAVTLSVLYMVWENGFDYLTGHVIWSSENNEYITVFLGCDADQFGRQVLMLQIPEVHSLCL
jgi:hypothetical protein